MPYDNEYNKKISRDIDYFNRKYIMHCGTTGQGTIDYRSEITGGCYSCGDDMVGGGAGAKVFSEPIVGTGGAILGIQSGTVLGGPKVFRENRRFVSSFSSLGAPVAFRREALTDPSTAPQDAPPASASAPAPGAEAPPPPPATGGAILGPLKSFENRYRYESPNFHTQAVKDSHGKMMTESSLGRPDMPKSGIVYRAGHDAFVRDLGNGSPNGHGYAGAGMSMAIGSGKKDEYEDDSSDESSSGGSSSDDRGLLDKENRETVMAFNREKAYRQGGYCSSLTPEGGGQFSQKKKLPGASSGPSSGGPSGKSRSERKADKEAARKQKQEADKAKKDADKKAKDEKRTAEKEKKKAEGDKKKIEADKNKAALDKKKAEANAKKATADKKKAEIETKRKENADLAAKNKKPETAAPEAPKPTKQQNKKPTETKPASAPAPAAAPAPAKGAVPTNGPAWLTTASRVVDLALPILSVVMGFNMYSEDPAGDFMEMYGDELCDNLGANPSIEKIVECLQNQDYSDEEIQQFLALSQGAVSEQASKEVSQALKVKLSAIENGNKNKNTQCLDALNEVGDSNEKVSPEQRPVRKQVSYFGSGFKESKKASISKQNKVLPIDNMIPVSGGYFKQTKDETTGRQTKRKVQAQMNSRVGYGLSRGKPVQPIRSPSKTKEEVYTARQAMASRASVAKPRAPPAQAQAPPAQTRESQARARESAARARAQTSAPAPSNEPTGMGILLPRERLQEQSLAPKPAPSQGQSRGRAPAPAPAPTPAPSRGQPRVKAPPSKPAPTRESARESAARARAQPPARAQPSAPAPPTARAKVQPSARAQPSAPPRAPAQPEMAETSGKGKPNKRAEIVKKVMKQQGMSMIEASKYVKANGLY